MCVLRLDYGSVEDSSVSFVKVKVQHAAKSILGFDSVKELLEVDRAESPAESCFLETCSDVCNLKDSHLSTSGRDVCVEVER